MKGKKFSLRWYMLALVIGCWVLPVLLLTGLFFAYVNNNMRSRALEMVTVSADNATNLTLMRLQESVNAALDASYTPTLKKAWAEYQKSLPNGTSGIGAVYLNKTTQNYLQEKYADNLNVKLAVVSYFNEEPTIVYHYDTTRYTYERKKTFQTPTSDGQSPEQIIMSRTSLQDNSIRFWYIEGEIYLVRNLYDANFRPYARLMLQLEQNVIFESIQTMTGNDQYTLLMGDVLVSVKGERLDVEHWPLPITEVSQGVIQDNRLYISGSKQTDWVRVDYYLSTDYQALMPENSNVIWVVLAVAGLVVLLFSAFMAAFLRRVNHPLSLIVGASQKVEQGEFGAQVDVERMKNTEMQYMAEQFNHMSNQLQYQFERIYREELALRDARIMALQSQINPHFLGNTLEVINWEARLVGNVKVSLMLEALSTILEATMDRRHRSIILLSEELHYVNAYLTIIGQRLGRRLTVKREIDESLLDSYVPRLVMQPILENAVEHGVGNRPHGTIIIRVRRENDNWMVLEVENDQPLAPKDEENIAQILNDDEQPSGVGSTRLGIRNVHQRLRIIYGEESGLTVKTHKNSSTVSSMRIKLTQDSQI